MATKSNLKNNKTRSAERKQKTPSLNGARVEKKEPQQIERFEFSASKLKRGSASEKKAYETLPLFIRQALEHTPAYEGSINPMDGGYELTTANGVVKINEGDFIKKDENGILSILTAYQNDLEIAQ